MQLHELCTSSRKLFKNPARPFMSAVIILFVAIFIYFNSHYYICCVRFMLFIVFVSVRFFFVAVCRCFGCCCCWCFCWCATRPPVIRTNSCSHIFVHEKEFRCFCRVWIYEVSDKCCLDESIISSSNVGLHCRLCSSVFSLWLTILNAVLQCNPYIYTLYCESWANI